MSVKKLSQANGQASTSTHRQPNLRQRILVVNDDPEIRRVITEVLIYSGYHADASEDGAAAWDALQLNNYDLMVIDNNMPKVTGVELIEKLRDARMDLPVIMAMGSLPEADSIRRSLHQPNIILLKPFTFDELVVAVKEVLRVTSDARNEIAPPPDWQVQPLADRFRL